MPVSNAFSRLNACPPYSFSPHLPTVSCPPLPLPPLLWDCLLFLFVVSPATNVTAVWCGFHAAGVAVGPAALFVLRGLVCLQCNVKLPKLVPCGTCKLKFCKSCQITHCCIGRLPLPRGVAEASSSVGGGGRGSSVSKGVFFGSGSKSEGAGAGGGRFTPEHHPRWELGSAIGDDWEALFSEVREERETDGVGSN